MKNDNNQNSLIQNEPDQAQSASLLPVIDILNNLRVVCNYVSAVRYTHLPKFIRDNVNYASLVSDFSNWKVNLWQQLQMSLLADNIVAQVVESKNMILGKVKDESVYKTLFNREGGSTSTTISVSDDLANLIQHGEHYLIQLESIASGIEGYDEEQIKALNGLISDLDTQFDALEQQITDKAFDDGKAVISTSIDVGVALATEEDPIARMAKGVSQVGENVVKGLIISKEVQSIVNQLEALWRELDQVTLQYAQVKLLVDNLNKIVPQTSVAVTSLGNFANDWQEVYNVITDKDKWGTSGYNQFEEWVDRMFRMDFPGAFQQTVYPN